MSIVSLALKCAVKTPKVEAFDTYLFIGPHPDDIEIGAGATIAKLAQLNKKIIFLICTDGRFGDGAGDITGEELVKVRKQESIQSAQALGVSDVRFLNLQDGAGYTKEQLRQGIAQVISDVRPDIVFAPDSRSLSESHPDHIQVGEVARQIVCFAPYQNLMLERFGVQGAPVHALALYMTARPNRFVKVRGFLKQQLKALFENHISQYPPGAEESQALKLYLQLRYLQYAGREGFRVYTQTHMHCLPEAK